MKITRFEDIKAWQEARELVILVYSIINASERFKKDFRLINQIQGAAVSCMSNIAEGFARKGKREFIQYLFISKSSATEVQTCPPSLSLRRGGRGQLYVALDQNYVSRDEFDKIYSQAEKVSKMISGFIKYLPR